MPQPVAVGLARRRGVSLALPLLLTARRARAAASPGVAQDARVLYRQAQDAFVKDGDVRKSAELFDAVLAIAPEVRPRLWQRGISLYYAGRYDDAAKQFRDDAVVNANDSEEAIWALISESGAGARADAFEDLARDIVAVRNERRPVMRIVYNLFANKATVDDVLALRDGKGGYADFYALLYLGLYTEARGDADAARSYMTDANATRYAQSSGDFMADVSRVHAAVRGWS